jgi:hypothetical protein
VALIFIAFGCVSFWRSFFWDSGQKFLKKFEAPIHPPLVIISGPLIGIKAS